jgi:hypothetical protein
MHWSEAVSLAVKLLAACVCGVGLWWAWKASLRELGGFERGALTLGFALRAIGGVSLFWVSYLSLGVGRSFQVGGGLWWFALDGYEYMRLARQAVASGPLGIATLSTTTPSVIFVQTLATLMAILGIGVGAGLLLNCVSFLAGNLLLASWGREVEGKGREALAFAVFTVSLCPSWILWATQPLKDALFVALVLTWFFVSALWLGGDASRVASVRRRLGTIVILGVLLYAVAGIRAYFAVFLWVGLGAGLFLRSMRGTRERLGQIAVEWCVWALLSQVIVLSAAPYIPRPARWLIAKNWTSHQEKGVSRDDSIGVAARDAKRGFVQAGGATRILPGIAAEVPAAPGKVAALGGRVQGGSVVKDGGSGGKALSRPSTAAEPAAPSGQEAARGGASRDAGESMPPREIDRSDTLRSLVVGLAALFLPRVAAEALGLLHIGGGQGFWAFAEVDTLFFTLAAVVSGVLTIRAFRRSRMLTAAALQVIVSACVVIAALAFVVTNFGTLFRLREMVLVCFAVLPLAASGRNGGGGDSCVG